MLEKGKVIESGSHEELIAIPNGKYAEMSRLALGEEKPKSEESTPVAKENNHATGQSNASFTDDDATAINTPLPLSGAASPHPNES